MRGPVRLAVAAIALLVLASPSGAVEIRRVESVGAVPATAAQAGGSAPRDAALQDGLFEAVRRVAIDLVTGGEPPAPEEEVLPRGMAVEVLGNDPLVYITRFRILEDRGERPALFVEDPEVETEYVVVTEVHVDVDRLRSRLSENGLLAMPSGESPRLLLEVTVEGVDRYDTFEIVREALIEAAGARSAMLIEARHGIGVFQVETEGRAPDLLNALLRLDRPGLRIAPLAAGERTVGIRVEWAPPEPAEAEPEATGAIDTPARKRY